MPLAKQHGAERVEHSAESIAQSAESREQSVERVEQSAERMEHSAGRTNRWHVVFFLTALVVAAADQLSKHWIRSYPEGDFIFQAGFFRIIHASNTGAAFGILQDKSFLLTIVAFIGILVILLFKFLFSRQVPFLNTTPGQLVLGLILGCTIGNLIDRLRFGQVTDWISVGIWPTFNVADSAVSVGVVLFAYLFLFSNKSESIVKS